MTELDWYDDPMVAFTAFVTLPLLAMIGGFFFSVVVQGEPNASFGVLAGLFVFAIGFFVMALGDVYSQD